MSTRWLLPRAAFACLLGLLCLAEPTHAADTDVVITANGGCAFCAEGYSFCPSDTTVQALCQNKCGVTGFPVCGELGTCAGTSRLMGCISPDPD